VWACGTLSNMQAPLCIRPLSADERIALEAGLRSSFGFTVRRCQMLLSCADGVHTTAIARSLRCNDQTVRNAIHDFHQRGLASLQPKSSRPHRTLAIFTQAGRERLRTLLHQSPRTFGQGFAPQQRRCRSELRVGEGSTVITSWRPSGRCGAWAVTRSQRFVRSRASSWSLNGRSVTRTIVRSQVTCPGRSKKGASRDQVAWAYALGKY
jgi:hypothetical protein